MKIVIADTGALISLGLIGKIDLGRMEKDKN